MNFFYYKVFFLFYLLFFAFNSQAADVVKFKGLYWQQVDDGVGRTWYEAKDYCKKLKFGGSHNWRLPTRKELARSIECDNGKSPDEDDDWNCNDGPPSSNDSLRINKVFSTSAVWGWYWTSTEDERYVDSEDSAFVVEYVYGSANTSFIKGYEFENQTFDNLYSRCVSLSPPNPGIDLILKKGKLYKNFISKIQEGDILLFSSCDGNVSNPLSCSPFPGVFGAVGLGYGYYRHAALVYEKNGDKVTIIHARGPATGTGTDILSRNYLSSYKTISLLRVKNISETKRKQAAQYAYDNWNNTGYDSLFLAYNSKVYCSELVWDAYKNIANISLADKSAFPLIPSSIFYPDMLSQSQYLNYVTAYKGN